MTMKAVVIDKDKGKISKTITGTTMYIYLYLQQYSWNTID